MIGIKTITGKIGVLGLLRVPGLLRKHMGDMCLSRLCLLFFMLNVQFPIPNSQFSILNSQWSISTVSAQTPSAPKIGGNVYGGGNKGDVGGNATVTVKGGDIEKVFGGARMANVGGRTFVNIDGEHASTDVFITEVYGGNDISGTIGESGEATTIPTELTNIMPDPLPEGKTKADYPEKNEIDDTWKTFVRTSRSKKDDGTGNYVENKVIIIGSLFGGGNGDYDYVDSEPADGKVTQYVYNKGDRSTAIATKVTPTGEEGFLKPNLPKTYLELNGGCIAHAFGGGNFATITENTTISINNESDDLETLAAAYATATGMSPEAVFAFLLERVKLSSFQSNTTSWKYNFARVFGGNNKADMAIRPVWNLQTGKIRDLYSGGNEGRMTHEDGLLLVIEPEEDNPLPLVIENVYGGCRMADVRPKNHNVWDPSLENPVTGLPGDYADVQTVKKVPGYYFPPNMATHTLINGGDINNVYGGNDIKGKVYFGNAVGVTTSIRGDIYGGGNGAYAYTDNGVLKDNPQYSDFYYDIPSETTPVEALLDVRPDAEQVSVMVRGTVDKPTIIGGSIYCGGNCATLETEESHKNLPNYPITELKIGSYVFAENVYLGNNGTGMVSEDVLKIYKTDFDGNPYNSMNLLNSEQMKTYMKGAAMSQIPTIVTESEENGDHQTYIAYTSHIGSLFLGGNVGSMTYAGKNTMILDKPIDIYTKLVGGCNNAIVKEGTYNAAHIGGILGTDDELLTDGYKQGGKIKDRLELSFNGMQVEPRRLNNVYSRVTNGTTLTRNQEYYTSNIPSRAEKIISDGTEIASNEHPYYEMTVRGTSLEWNTVKWNSDLKDFTAISTAGTDADRRLLDGNVYGGCYNSGIVNGNVVININQNVQDKDEVFDSGTSNVDYESQREDLMTLSMSVFGAGMGEDTEIWGSTTLNLNKGYVFQMYGGGEKGVVGKEPYAFSTDYNSTVNLNGVKPIYSDEGTDPLLAEAEYLYGGGNEGDVCGNTYVYLGHGRIYDAFGGANDADVLGHTEVHIGRQPDGSGGLKDGFPWIRDIVFGGNDFGGEIKGVHEDGYDFTALVRDYATIKEKIHGYNGGVPEVIKAASYVGYYQGKVEEIFGGSYAGYDYNNTELYGTGAKPPYQSSAFVNIRPNTNENNYIKTIFGGGTGYSRYRPGDKSQDRSYVLIDIPKKDDEYLENFKKTEVFGAGSYNGVGMGVTPATAAAPETADQASAIIDLWRGQLGNVFGGSYNEGNTRRTVINVPVGSTIKMYTNEPSSEKIDGLTMKLPQKYGNIFGGAYGTQILPPCDVYESNVNYHSEDAIVNGCIYGGNNNERRTLRTKVNITSPVWQTAKNGYTGTVFGAGQGKNTWSEYTEVNLLEGAMVYEVYGGGMMGHVLNAESVQKYMKSFADSPSPDIIEKDEEWGNSDKWEGGEVGSSLKDDDGKTLTAWHKAWHDAWALGDYYTPDGTWEDYAGHTETNLSSISDRPELDADAKAASQFGEKKFNSNVIISEGAYVGNYAYGGGYGKKADPLSGDVYGTTYIALLGGEVGKDIYASGTAGGVYDLFGAKNFTATANAYILGGTVRNVYGGGWRGSVGYHNGDISNVSENANDIFGNSNVVIGKKGSDTHTEGDPSVTRNVYGGGEGGNIYGTANVYINNGHIGYRYKNTATGEDPEDWQYVPELDDADPGDDLLEKSGNVFGGGYVANSYVDNTNVKMYGGTIRGCLFGGGEIGPIGRGTMAKTQAFTESVGGIYTNGASIYKPGTTHIEIYEGHILRDVFGGGRGQDNWGGEGWMTDSEKLTMDRSAKGYIFGQTAVYVHGGEIGTVDGVTEGFGNVFGGCDMGNVYSAYVINKSTNGFGKKSGVRYNKGLLKDDPAYDDDGYYYKYEGSFLTDDGEKIPTEDCKVTVGPNCRVKEGSGGITFTGIHYPQHTIIPEIDLNYMKENDITGFDANGKVTNPSGITFSRSYNEGEYVSTYALHTLKDKTTDSSGDGQWAKLDDAGIIIHNAVFAGGNISAGSEGLVANTTTIYGNATAAIHDVYHRDLITIGTGHTGGLYGDGNLTLVDGYRSLNITNYGTDYYNISQEISIEAYNRLPAREQDYYELRYVCIKACIDNEDKSYTPADGSLKASTITADELLARFEGIDTDEGTPMLDGSGKPDPTYWKENGVCSRYAGRIMNTIQRADFCGVFGSRMVMQGAKDRVTEVADNANYTINRVREVSLNKKNSAIAGDTEPYHGNYFGIYSNVKFLGALTSDVFMTDVRQSAGTGDLAADGSTTYVGWKEAHKTDRKRNRAKSYNEVALASGVYLEITTELSTGSEVNQKDWGYVTGVVSLDLINNIQTGAGGGFVYAKNVHGVPTYDRKEHATLSALNAQAVTRKDFTYKDPDDYPDDQEYWETSGNFVHDTQTIIDDCYPVSNRYVGPSKVPAHYWYIKGSVYVYDQYITAYTGAPNAYSEVVNIPLTISAASNGKMQLMNVMPNRYAYYSNGTKKTKLTDEDILELRDKEYKLNEPISYWDYTLLSSKEKLLFVEKTYVTIAECEIAGNTYPSGYVMLPDEYERLKTAAPLKTIEGEEVKAVTSGGKDVAFDFVFRESNNLSHDTGYILTYDVNNPQIWDEWYTPKTDDATGKITKAVFDGLTKIGQDGYNNGPTYKPQTAGLYGQQEYEETEIISKNIYVAYEGEDKNGDGDYEDDGDTKGLKQNPSVTIPATGQAEFEPAWIVTNTIDVTTDASTPVHLYPGATIAKSDYESKWATMSSSVQPAFVCTSTLELAGGEFIVANMVMSEDEMDAYIAANPSMEEVIRKVVQPAYYCKTAGLYGGNYYSTNGNYRGLAIWSSMSETDRENFDFNYDALDLLIDSHYSGAEGQKYQYDSKNANLAGAEANKAHYSLEQPVDYTATYDGESAMTYKDKNNASQSVSVGQELVREDFESLPNEQRHYAPIKVPTEPEVVEGVNKYRVHVVNSPFIHGETPYAVGQTIGNEDFKGLNSEDLAHVSTLEFLAGDAGKTFFYCRESYEVNHNGEGQPVKAVMDSPGVTAGNTKTSGQTVPIGFVISEDGEGVGHTYGYKSLTNRQQNFTIHGVAPVETSTLYVSHDSDIYNLSTEKIITVIYRYDYEEADEKGNVAPVSERHILNIHIKFESGVPTIEDIAPPKIVLPGTLVQLHTPNVTPGAYEVTGGGWTLFEREEDAESHTNGIPYAPNSNPLYWYQNNYWVAYYAQTYLGKTYSNAVQVSVANYHDLAEVMSETNKTHHMYIDYPYVERDPKIYINNTDGLTQFKDLFDLSLLDGTQVNLDPATGLITTDKDTELDSKFKGHALLNTQVKADQNLEFFLHTDLTHEGEWTPIGESTCFEGILHGDGHSINGLDHSLFNKLCGNIYNLGVTGSFTGAGIAEEGSGYMENCWISTSSTEAKTSKPLFGNPNRSGDDPKGTIQMVNTYYQEEADAVNKYTNHSGSHGIPTRKPARAFYNGEVAYNLNGFYLYKRYNDNANPGGATTYKYWTNTDETTPLDGTYAANEALCSSGFDGFKYVEGRFADGDFRYAGGTIPDYEDERHWIEEVEKNEEIIEVPHWSPIWPDDYLFFGQALNYDQVEDLTHQNVPSTVNRSGGRVDYSESGNRVYRAPAYYRNSIMSVAHFNPYAVFAKNKYGDANVLAYKDMTAIDFTDAKFGLYDHYKAYEKGSVDVTINANTVSTFYPPLLDDCGLSGLRLSGFRGGTAAELTKNLLVYTFNNGGTGEGETPTATQQTANVVRAALGEPSFTMTDTKYCTVDWEDTAPIHGHWIKKPGDSYLSERDHLLVDKNDFNAPIAYDFESDKRMWYQRTPDNFVDRSKGWEDVSLPFTAKLVTTQDKGEITHFYDGSDKSKNGTGTKIGHEYWLREIKENSTMTLWGSEPDVLEAKFQYPARDGSDTEDKTVTNTFLWDYFYKNESLHNQKDKNYDTYQEYYSRSREYSEYAMLTRGIPYIIGFPGETYYEFDLSGNFIAQNTATDNDPGIGAPTKPLQTITFASKEGCHIYVSDTEKTGRKVSYNGKDYYFTPSYLNEVMDAYPTTPASGTTYPVSFTLNATGNSYDLVKEASPVTASAFRPFFTGTITTSAGTKEFRHIKFHNVNDGTLEPDDEEMFDGEDGSLKIFTRGRNIHTVSYLKESVDIRIVNASGATITTYTLEPGKTVVTPITNPGAYIVNKKKVFIK